MVNHFPTIVLLLNQLQSLFAKQLEINNEFLCFVAFKCESKQKFLLPLSELQQFHYTIVQSKYLYIHLIYQQFRLVLLSMENIGVLETSLKSLVNCEHKQLSPSYLQNIYRISLYFNRDLERDEIVWEDSKTKNSICCKDVWRAEQNLLNDIIIDYCMNFTNRKSKILYMQTDFFVVLQRNFERSLSFIKNISLLDKQFIFIPFCLQHHWMLFCVYEIANQQKRKIIIFDSLDFYFETLQLEIIMIRRFLSHCISLETNTSVKFDASNLGVKKAQVPIQTNSIDCGIYILLYMDKISQLMRNQWCDRNLFSADEVMKKRSEIVSKIYESCFLQCMSKMIKGIE